MGYLIVIVIPSLPYLSKKSFRFYETTKFSFFHLLFASNASFIRAGVPMCSKKSVTCFFSMVENVVGISFSISAKDSSMPFTKYLLVT